MASEHFPTSRRSPSAGLELAPLPATAAASVAVEGATRSAPAGAHATARSQPAPAATQQLIELASTLLKGISGQSPACALFLLDGDAVVLAANPEAECVWAQERLRTTVNGRPTGRDGFREGLQAALATITKGLCSASFRNGQGSQHWEIGSCRIPVTAQLNSVTLVVMKPQTSGPSALAVHRQLRQNHGLSPSEATLLWQLHQCESLREAAAAIGISIGNARTKLKRAMGKTGARSQSTLILLVERTLRAVGDDASAAQ
jgi:DNA-binding CsgD family transcriptional regulator